MMEWQADPQAADAGLLAIGARFSAAAGLGLGRDAGGVLDALAPPRRPGNPVRQVPLSFGIPVSGGAGTFTGAIGYQGPPVGWYWSIRRLTAQGFTAGVVNIFAMSINGEIMVPLSQAGTATFGRGEELLHPQSYLVAQASGITGTVTVYGRADAFPDWYLSEYLG